MTPPPGRSGASNSPGQLSRVTMQVGDGVVVIAAIGRIDQLAAVAFREELLEVWPVCVGTLVVDLSACTYLSIDAVRVLQDIWRRSPPGRAQLQVTADHPDVTAVLDAAHIPRIRVSSDPVHPALTE
jgi:anti-anti-sigma factor